jgi:transcriptional pleiotropic regulator of transition state genes
MKATGIVRKIDKLGRIVIPIEIRRSLNFDENTNVEMMIDKKNNNLVMGRYEKGCFFCGEVSSENIKFEEKNICSSCAEKISQKTV